MQQSLFRHHCINGEAVDRIELSFYELVCSVLRNSFPLTVCSGSELIYMHILFPQGKALDNPHLGAQQGPVFRWYNSFHVPKLWMQAGRSSWLSSTLFCEMNIYFVSHMHSFLPLPSNCTHSCCLGIWHICQHRLRISLVSYHCFKRLLLNLALQFCISGLLQKKPLQFAGKEICMASHCYFHSTDIQRDSCQKLTFKIQ